MKANVFCLNAAIGISFAGGTTRPGVPLDLPKTGEGIENKARVNQAEKTHG